MWFGFVFGYINVQQSGVVPVMSTHSFWNPIQRALHSHEVGAACISGIVWQPILTCIVFAAGEHSSSDGQNWWRQPAVQRQ